jgi:hypothetical protein
MTTKKSMRIGILVNAGQHNQAVIDDLWGRALSCLDPLEWDVRGTAAYIGAPGELFVEPGSPLDLVPVEQTVAGRPARIVASLAAKPGPVGVVGRLLRDNLRSRGVARAVAQRKDVLAALAASDVVVSGDVSGDRAVWQLRKRTRAGLVHGPVAMVHAIRTLTRP